MISKENWQTIGKPAKTPCKGQALSASGDQVPILGKFNARLKLFGREDIGPCYVANSNLNLLGNDWMEARNLWNIPIASVCNNIKKEALSPLDREVQIAFPNLYSDLLASAPRKHRSRL